MPERGAGRPPSRRRVLDCLPGGSVMSERVRPSRDQAHLIVAGVRVLAHRESVPPRVADVAELLGMSPELLGVAVRVLVELGVLREVADAYGARLEIGDHLKIEELAAGGGPALQTE